MLPGLSGCGARGILTLLPVWTNFYTDASTTFTVPAGYSIARVSAIGLGGNGLAALDGDGIYRQGGGGGGEFRQSIVTLTPGETLTAIIDATAARLQRGSSDLVRANSGSNAFLFAGYMFPGSGASGGVGQAGHNGASGDSVGYGGGAGGSTADASGQTRGAGQSWTRSADNAFAINGGAGSNYGGGGNSFGSRGAGIIIIEFGASTLTAA